MIGAKVLKMASKIQSMPVVSILSPRHAETPTEEMKEGFLACQRLAEEAAHEVSALIREGWTELQAADLLETYLRDRGVKAFFHHSYAWYGERARFDGIRSYGDYMPSKRVILPGEVFILDVAPIYRGFTADIGYTSSLGENAEWKQAQTFLQTLREEIPGLVKDNPVGGRIWEIIDEKIRSAGYENIHKKYPFSVLGHRVHHGIAEKIDLRFRHFGWQSFWSLVSRGLFGQLLNQNHEGDLLGMWAIEPHIGTLQQSSRANFGAKFEEILVIEKEKVYWLESERVWQ